jgi:uncharacterized protein with FMN-binding domain
MNRIAKAALAAIFILVLFAGTNVFAQSTLQYKDGTYSLDYKDDELGSVSISVTVKNGAIATIALPNGKGSLTLEDNILAAYIDSLIKASSYLDADVVSGASADSDLIKYAIMAALKGAQ